MAFVVDHADQLRLFLGLSADHEEGRANPLRREDFQNARRRLGTRAIVERQRDRTRHPSWQTQKDLAPKRQQSDRDRVKSNRYLVSTSRYEKAFDCSYPIINLHRYWALARGNYGAKAPVEETLSTA